MKAAIGGLAVVGLTAPAHPAVAAKQVIETRAGQQVVIALKGNPSTGYSWQHPISRRDRKLLRIDGCAWTVNKRPKGMVGAPGLYRCRITALKPGSAALTFRYLRVWEKTRPPARTRIYQFIIK